MKYHLSRLAVFAVLLFLLSGCTPVGEQPPAGPIVLSDELLALLETVNAEHKAIVKPEIDEAVILERWARDTYKYVLDYQIVGSMTDGMLTAQQAKNDVNVLFYNLQTKYGLYEYFGGDEIFESAREVILHACDGLGSLAPADLVKILTANLSFVKDGHFRIGDYPVAMRIFPFHHRDVAFEKTDAGYRTIPGGKLVTTVEGYEDLDSLFRRSISSVGSIVYYPIVLAELTWQESRNNPDYTPGDLVICYADGSTQTLSTMPQSSSYNEERANVELYENQTIPVLFSRKMGFDEAGEAFERAFLAYAEQLRDESVLVLDLRSNRGGSGVVSHKWLHAFTGEKIASNSYGVTYATRIGEGHTLASSYAEILGRKQIGGGLTLSEGQPDAFVMRDNLLVVLTGKQTASAAELMVDLLHNVGNVLFVGDMTSGCYLGDAAYTGVRLPHSLIPVQFGALMRVFPTGDYFQEGRGFLPDLWVPAAQAEELAIRLLLNNK